MRIRLFIEQLALIGALSSLVLAALWPHVRPLAFSIWSRMRNLDILNWRKEDTTHHTDDWNVPKMYGSLANPPRLRGYTLKRPNVSICWLISAGALYSAQ